MGRFAVPVDPDRLTADVTVERYTSTVEFLSPPPPSLSLSFLSLFRVRGHFLCLPVDTRKVCSGCISHYF